MYSDKFVRDNVAAPFVLLSIVIVSSFISEAVRAVCWRAVWCDGVGYRYCCGKRLDQWSGCRWNWAEMPRS